MGFHPLAGLSLLSFFNYSRVFGVSLMGQPDRGEPLLLALLTNCRVIIAYLYFLSIFSPEAFFQRFYDIIDEQKNESR